METKDLILGLRKRLALSQDEFAGRLFVTRQAVSRWERGDTIPNIDTLKLMAETFQVSVDHLLSHPAGHCQSCGMMLAQDSDKGTEKDGSLSEEYCAFCFRDGAFAGAMTMEEIMEHNLRALGEWNQSSGLNFTEQEAREQLSQFLPTLKRWRA